MLIRINRFDLRGSLVRVAPFLILALAFFAHGTALSCESFDFEFEPTGHFVVGERKGKLAYLAPILHALFETGAGEPQVSSLRVHVNGQEKLLTIVHHLDNGSEGRSLEYGVSCHNDEWRYLKVGKTSAEGVFREYELSVTLKLIEDGRLQVRSNNTIIRGLLFKSTTVASETAVFNRKSQR